MLVGHDNAGSERLFRRITSAFPETDFMLVIGQGLYYQKSLFASVVKLLGEASWLFLFMRTLSLARDTLRRRSLKRAAKELGIPTIYTRDINSDETVTEVREFKPDLLVSLFTLQLYKSPILSVPRLGSIQSHPSLLPYYRGLEVFFWVLANNERETGVSVYFLTERIDDGEIIRQRVLEIEERTSVESMYDSITEIGADLLIEAIGDIDADEVRPIPKRPGKGSYFGMPTRKSMKRFRKTRHTFF